MFNVDPATAQVYRVDVELLGCWLEQQSNDGLGTAL